jgi:hypothetical protein
LKGNPVNEPLQAAPAPVAVALFDPFSIEDVSTGTLRVRDEAGAPTSWVITLAGPEHPDRKRRLHARQRRLRAVLSKTGKLPMSDPEDDEADELDDLVACTLGWEGAAVAYSPQAVRSLYADSRLGWLRAQVKMALEERERFMRTSAPA